MGEGRRLVFIEAPGVLWEKPIDDEKCIQFDAAALAILEQSPLQNCELILIVEESNPLSLEDCWSLVTNTSLDGKIVAVQKANTERKMASEIRQCLDNTNNVDSFAIISLLSMERYFPRNTIHVVQGDLTVCDLQKVKEILDRSNRKEYYYNNNQRRTHWRILEKAGPEKVIFLDIDGVLNTDGKGPKIEDRFVARLAQIVEQTDAEIILSSSWRGSYLRYVHSGTNYENKDIDLLLEILERYHLRIAGTTPDISSGPYARPFEIRTWLSDQADLQRFVILDDETFWAWNWLAEYLVCTMHQDDRGECTYGLSDDDVVKAVAILNQKG